MGTQLVDKFSLLHFFCGVLARILGIELSTWVFINICYELIENNPDGMKLINLYIDKLGGYWPGGKKVPDNAINSLSDIVFAILGWTMVDKFYN